MLQPAEVLENAPETFVTKDATGFKGFKYRMQVSALDCTGCGSCANVCPAKVKALTMIPLEDALKNGEDKNWDYSVDLPDTPADFNVNTVKGSQFKQPLFEFSGACAGCGETPYIKVITQLFGDRMVIANATGCSSIYGGSAPTCPYSKNKKGHGPAWSNSLFEDNAEFGYGINLAYKYRRNELKDLVAQLSLVLKDNADCKEACDNWINNMNDAEGSKRTAAELVKVISALKGASADADALIDEILKREDCLIKKSVWIFGGDGWAYDIGYGGLDHVIASGEDVNILVLDTEVYSNTGGQASKSTPTGSVAKFAAGGKLTKKKDLGKIAMTYEYVYVAECSMGADKAQFVKAISEAEAYHGPSLIICYAPCINHGINMSKSQNEEKLAVESGYWQLYRYNPSLIEKGQNPFSLDSKKPTGDYQAFLMGENRYAQLAKAKPEVAKELFARNEKEARIRYEEYSEMAKHE